MADATVVSVTRDDSMIGGGAASLEVVIPRADVAAVLGRHGRRVGALGRSDGGRGAMTILVAVDEPHGSALAAGLEREGMTVVTTIPASALASVAADEERGLEAERILHALAAAETVVLQADRTTLTAAAVGMCDRAGVRIVPLVASESERGLVAAFGLTGPWPLDIEPWRLADALAAAPLAAAEEPLGAAPPARRRGVGPCGRAGPHDGGDRARRRARARRAAGCARRCRHPRAVHRAAARSRRRGPRIRRRLPHRAARRTRRARTRADLDTARPHAGVDVLTGLNRPSRWPELSAARVPGALAACREWADYTIVDVAAPARAGRGDRERPRRTPAERRDDRGARDRRSRRRGRRRRSGRHLAVPPRARRSCGRRSARRPSPSSRTGCAPARSASTRAGRSAARSSGSGECRTSGSFRRTHDRRMPRSSPHDPSPRSLPIAAHARGPPLRGRGDRAGAGAQRTRAAAARPARAAASVAPREPPPDGGRRRRPRDARRPRLNACRPSAISSMPKADPAKRTSNGCIGWPATGSCWPISPSPTS